MSMKDWIVLSLETMINSLKNCPEGFLFLMNHEKYIYFSYIYKLSLRGVRIHKKESPKRSVWLVNRCWLIHWLYTLYVPGSIAKGECHRTKFDTAPQGTAQAAPPLRAILGSYSKREVSPLFCSSCQNGPEGVEMGPLAQHIEVL